MPVLVRISSALTHYANCDKEVKLEGDTVGSVLSTLVIQHKDLEHRIREKDVKIYLDNEDIHYLQGDLTPVLDGSEILIVKSLSGGHSPADSRS